MVKNVYYYYLFPSVKSFLKLCNITKMSRSYPFLYIVLLNLMLNKSLCNLRKNISYLQRSYLQRTSQICEVWSIEREKRPPWVHAGTESGKAHNTSSLQRRQQSERHRSPEARPKIGVYTLHPARLSRLHWRHQATESARRRLGQN